MIKTRHFAALLLALPLAGCITVDPPDKPIDINLNVRIEQEVLVRLDREVGNLIEENPEVFPATPEATPDEPLTEDPGADE